MGVQRLSDFTGVASCEGGTGHAPGDRTRNPCAPFLAIFHLYTSENPSTPRLSLYSCSPPPSSRPARRPGYAQGRRRGHEPSARCTARAPRIFQYLFIIVPKVRPPLILVPPDALKSKLHSRGKVDTRVLFNVVYTYIIHTSSAIV